MLKRRNKNVFLWKPIKKTCEENNTLNTDGVYGYAPWKMCWKYIKR